MALRQRHPVFRVQPGPARRVIEALAAPRRHVETALANMRTNNHYAAYDWRSGWLNDGQVRVSSYA